MLKSARMFIALALAAAPWLPLRAETPAAGQTAQKLDRELHVKLDYLLYLPKDYGKEQDKKWPLILFLHGAGERGSDVNVVKKHGPPKLVQGDQETPAKQFIVVSPQCPEGRWWQPQEVIALLDEITEKYKVDQDRVYLTGLSMGGFGTWDTAMRFPDRFAAIAPICGGGEPRRVGAIKKMPTWVFHGEKDNVVPIAQSEEMVDALKRAGGDPKFTRYPEANHDSWTVTYNNPELYAWFLEHKRAESSAKK